MMELSDQFDCAGQAKRRPGAIGGNGSKLVIAVDDETATPDQPSKNIDLDDAYLISYFDIGLVMVGIAPQEWVARLTPRERLSQTAVFPS